MAASIKKENSIFFNHSFDKKRLKALISWVFKRSGEAEALRVLDLLKEIGFRHATKAGISIGLHDLTTPIQKSWLISESQISMNTTDRDFAGARITATERSQRIIDTWHRASESLSKQVVDYFGIYDQFNPVYIMALSGARGNFSQVRQLIGMRGLMADQQGKIVNFPIRSNLREGLTLTEYFISCSGARKGLVDTALRTADTGYLTRRLVDVSHHVVVKRIRCNTNRGIAFESLQSYNKIILALKERLVGRVLAEDIEISASCFAQAGTKKAKENNLLSSHTSKEVSFALAKPKNFVSKSSFLPLPRKGTPCLQNTATDLRVPLLSPTCPFLPCPVIFGGGAKRGTARHCKGNKIGKFNRRFAGELFASQTNGLLQVRSSKKRVTTDQTQQLIAKKDQEISQKLSLKIASVRDKVFIRSPLTCGFTHSVCQLCYGWSISQGSLVSLGDAVGVIAAQSIGEPGTQLTMRTFHTGGVFSGDLLQEIRAPHAGTIRFSKAFQGLLIRSAHGRIAFLSKMKGSLILSKEDDFRISSTRRNIGNNNGFTEIPLEAFTMLFVRQGEKVEKNQLLAEFSIQSKEGNQPIKTQQTIFSELSGRVVEERSGKSCTKSIKESILLSDPLPEFLSSCKTSKNTKQKIKKKRRSSESSKKAIALIPKGLAKAKPFRSFRAVFTNTLERPRCKNQGFAKAKLTPCAPARPLWGSVKGQGVSDKSYGSAYRKTGATLQSAKSHCRLKTKCPELQKNGCSVLICKKKSLVEKKKPGVTERLLQRFNLQGAKIARKPAVTLASKDWGLAKLTSLGVRISFALAKPEGGRKPINGFFLTPVNFRGCKGMHATENVSIKETKKWKKHNRVDMRAQSFTPNRIEREICIGNQAYAGNRKCKSQISSFLKNEDIENDRFKYIEPPKSGRLGFLKIISTRIGATFDYTSPIKPSNYHLIKRRKMQKHVLPICHVSSCFIPLQIHDLRTKISWWRSHLPLCVPYKCPAVKKIGTSTVGAKKEACRSLFREGKASHFSAHILDKEDGQVKLANPCFAVPVPITYKVNKEEQFPKNGQSKGQENFCSTTIGYGTQFNKKPIFFPFSPLQELEKSVKYLHPEYIQENRFILQTIAEYGDIVEETYKTKAI